MNFQANRIAYIAIHPQSRRKCNNNLKSTRLTVISMALASLLLYSDLGRAESWQQTLSALVSTEYDTNPSMIPAYQEEGIWRSIIAPSYGLTGALGAGELQSGVALNIVRTSNKTLSRDRNDPSAFLNWLLQGETGEVGIRARYAEISTRSTGFNGINPNFVDGTQETRTVSANWKKLLSERSTLDVNGAYTNTSFKEGGTFVDYANQAAGLTYSYTWSEFSSPFLSMTYDDYTPASNGVVTHRYGTMLGLNWKASDQLNGTVQAGQNRSDSPGSSDSAQGGMTLRYTEQKNRLLFNANRQAAASGLGGFDITDQINGNWSYDMSERNTTGVDLGWRKSRLLTDTYFRTAGVWLQRELGPYLGARLYYQRRISGGDTINEAFSNIIGISLTYTDPNF